jgi:hypothetical protein
MTGHARKWRGLVRVFWVCSPVALGCGSPDLSGTLFSCTTDSDCGPARVCAPFNGTLACQFPPSASGDACGGGLCSVAGVAASDAGLRTGARRASPEGLPRDTPLLVPGALGPSETPPEAARDAGPETASTSGGGAFADAGAAAEEPAPSVRFDFEADLQGWQRDLNQRPVDTLDSVEQSTALAHHGSGALRMVLDGKYTPIPPFVPDPRPFYGVYEAGAPPPGADVSLWLLSTAPGVSVEVYTQAGAAFTTTILASVPLPTNEWRQIEVTTPLAAARQFGLRLDSPLDLQGFVYLDEISW